MQNPPLYLLVP